MTAQGGAEPLGDVALHLGAEDEFGLERGDLLLDLEIVVGDQRLDAVELGGLTDLTGEFPRIGAEADDLEAELVIWAMRAAAIAWVASPNTNTRLPVR